MWYDIDYSRLAVLLIPPRLRKPVLTSFAQALFIPMANLQYKWKQKRLKDIYKIIHTPQRCYLRKALNDELDPALRRIYTGDGNTFPRKYIYTRAEKKPVFLGKMFIYQNSEFLNTGVDFIVYAPAEIINTNLDSLTALIDFYKLESKRYKIQPI